MSDPNFPANGTWILTTWLESTARLPITIELQFNNGTMLGSYREKSDVPLHSGGLVPPGEFLEFGISGTYDSTARTAKWDQWLKGAPCELAGEFFTQFQGVFERTTWGCVRGSWHEVNFQGHKTEGKFELRNGDAPSDAKSAERS
jgi:hypothetical protein